MRSQRFLAFYEKAEVEGAPSLATSTPPPESETFHPLPTGIILRVKKKRNNFGKTITIFLQLGEGSQVGFGNSRLLLGTSFKTSFSSLAMETSAKV